MHKFGVFSPPIPTNELLVQPAEGLPHIPRLMTNVTMDEALGFVASPDISHCDLTGAATLSILRVCRGMTGFVVLSGRAGRGFLIPRSGGLLGLIWAVRCLVRQRVALARKAWASPNS